MPAYDFFASKKRVNILKKVKINGAWKLCPAVVETKLALRDRVRVNGQIEVHPEGFYFLEWRENGRRVRESVPDKADVLRRARARALDIDPDRDALMDATLPAARRALPSIDATGTNAPAEFVPSATPPAGVAQLFFQAVESYIQNAVERAVGGPPHTPVPALVVDVDENETEPQPVAQLVALPPQSANGDANLKKISIADAVASYLKDLEPPQREEKTYKAYRTVLEMFRDTCPKQFLLDVQRDDCLNFIRHLYSLGNAPRTAHNRVTIVLQLLKLHGRTGILKSRDMPKYVEGVREMYKPQELEALFKACNQDEKVRYLFFLLTGERDKEVQHTSWDDIDFGRRCVRVTEKKELGFKPKDKEEREIPVPSSLLEALKKYRERQEGSNPHNLVFPTSNGRPDKKFENKLKTIAYHAGLNCGRCKSRHKHQCASGPHCGKWFLHKFRHTFATASLESGHSIRTLQEWLGHSDLESTMAYLKYVRRDDLHRMVDSSHLAGLVQSPAAS